MNISDGIDTKRAVRQFKDEALPTESIKAILNAGRKAQSSKNSQPWHFIAIQDRNSLEKLSKTGTYAGHMAGAALGVAIITPPFEQRFSIMFDAGQAAAYMQLAAWEIGIGSCLATIYEPDTAKDILRFPDEYSIYIAISFGYPLEEKNISRPPKKGGRRGFEDVVHWETW